MKDYQKPTFSVNMYDCDGDIFENGIYLHYGDITIKISNDIHGFKRHIGHLQSMMREIIELSRVAGENPVVTESRAATHG